MTVGARHNWRKMVPATFALTVTCHSARFVAGLQLAMSAFMASIIDIPLTEGRLAEGQGEAGR